MYELPKNNLHQAVLLLSGPVLCPEAAGVVLGHNVGWVMVDRSPGPTCALVWVQALTGFFCLGDWTNTGFVNEIGRAVGSELGHRVLSCGVKWFEVSGDAPEWDAALCSAFAAAGIHDVETESQHVYRYGQPQWHLVPDRSAARPIDIVLLSSEVGNRDFLEQQLLEHWVSLDRFIEAGLGYCSIVEGLVASICFSGAVSGAVHAVRVETLPEFRRRGLARSTAAALFEAYERRGISPYWDVMPDNTGSIATAKSLGLVRVYEYKVHSFKLC